MTVNCAVDITVKYSVHFEKPLVRKTDGGMWWYTLRCSIVEVRKDHSVLETNACYDSALYETYKECRKECFRRLKFLKPRCDKYGVDAFTWL